MKPYYQDNAVTIYHGCCLSVLRTMPDESVNCCVTSPPYFGLRDYGVGGQIGLEPTPDIYVAKMVEVFREVRRVLKNDGTVWLNLGDSYASYRDGKATPDTARGDNQGTLVPKGNAKNRMASTFSDTSIKHKDLIGIPWRVAFALQADGFYLRQDIIWHKPNPMPESVTDRCTKAHEYIFLLSKSARYYYDAEAIKEDCSRGDAGSTFTESKTGINGQWRTSQKPRIPHVPMMRDGFRGGNGTRYVNNASFNNSGPSVGGGASVPMIDTRRNKRSVWTVPTQPYPDAHFATFPPALIEPCVLAGCPTGGVVMDPFSGSGTTGEVALGLGRKYVGIELNEEYVKLSLRRMEQEVLPLDFGKGDRQ